MMNDKTVSLRMTSKRIADLVRMAAEETIRRGITVNFQTLIREAVEREYFTANAGGDYTALAEEITKLISKYMNGVK